MPVYNLPGPSKTWKLWTNRADLNSVPATTELDDYITANPAEALTVDFYFIGIPYDSWLQAPTFKSIMDDFYAFFQANNTPIPIVIAHTRADLCGLSNQSSADGAPTFSGREPTVAMKATPRLSSIPGVDWDWTTVESVLGAEGYTFGPYDEVQICPYKIGVNVGTQTVTARTNMMDIRAADWLSLHHAYSKDCLAYYGAHLLMKDHKEDFYSQFGLTSKLFGAPATYWSHLTNALTATVSNYQCMSAWLENGWRAGGAEEDWDSFSGGTGQHDFPSISWIEWVAAQNSYCYAAAAAGNPVWFDYPYLNTPWKLTHLSWTRDPAWTGDPYDTGQAQNSPYNMAVRKAMAMERATAIRDAAIALPAGSVIVIPEPSGFYNFSSDTGDDDDQMPVIELFTDIDWGGSDKWLMQAENTTTYNILQEAGVARVHKYVEVTRTATGSLADFAFLVDLANAPDEWWDTVQSTGSDIWASTGANIRLACDLLPGFDKNNKIGKVRVKSPFVTTGEYTIRVHCGADGPGSLPDPSSTYGRFAVYPGWLQYIPLDGEVATDRTVNAKDVTLSSLTFDVDGTNGQVGGGLLLTGNGNADAETGDYLKVGASLAAGRTHYSMSAWINAAVQAQANEDTVLSDWGTEGSFLMRYDSLNDLLDVFVRNSGGTALGCENAVVIEGALHMVSASVNGATGLVTVYLDGEPLANGIDFGSSIVTGTGTLAQFWGAAPFAANDGWKGILDELQQHNAARSATWWKEEYLQTTDNLTYWSGWSVGNFYGPVEKSPFYSADGLALGF